MKLMKFENIEDFNNHIEYLVTTTTITFNAYQRGDFFIVEYLGY